MGGINYLGIGVAKAVKQSFLDVRVDMSLGLLDQQKVCARLLRFLVFKLEELQRQVDQVGTTEAQLVDGSLIVVVRFADEQLQ